jgi:hypothetical protein
MQLAPQTVHRTLECVWIHLGRGFCCVWVEREHQSAFPAALLDQASAQEIASDPRRKVA